MANPEHVAILEKGIDVWNEWRAANLALRPDLSDARLLGASLRGIRLTRANLMNCDLRHVDLSEADLREADLTGTDLRDARLHWAHLNWAYLIEVNLMNARLNEADLHDANFTRAIMSGVDLTAAQLGGTRLDRSDLSGAHFFETQMGGTILAGLDLSTCKLLETVRHYGPSSLGIDTIIRSRGDIPLTFLRGVGVPDNFLVYARSLSTATFEFYSCFISYSTKDQKFANRLHADLQDKGVRCWFAPEDLKIGEPFRQRIDDSIRVHDKLLLILSEHSVRSTWVQDEVEAGLERERRENRLVLFPIRIDDVVMETEQAWATSIRRVRHIGDFTRWKDHDSYRRALERLLRDLKAEGSA